jgi:hypothetical protein
MRIIESIDMSPDWTSPRAWNSKAKILNRFNLTSYKLAVYARAAIKQKRHDVITTYQYVE